jgi:quercetin dioxygenase-like cupin family protein
LPDSAPADIRTNNDGRITKGDQSMKSVRCIAAIVTPVALLMTPALASAADAPSGHVMMNTADVKWGPAPPNLPKGVKIAVLYGDPGKPGPFVIRLMAPGGGKIAPHWHSQAENLTVVSGALYLGDGDKMDMKAAHALKAGGYHYLPGKAHHYAFTKTATVVQVHGEGPFDITYINPDDDPSKAPAKK